MNDLTVTPARNDSIEKLVHKLALLSPEPVTWGKRDTVQVKEPIEKVIVAPSVFRMFVCTAGCTACCWVDITLDYMPHEKQFWEIKDRYDFEERQVIVNGYEHDVMTFDRRREPGRCKYMAEDVRFGGPGCSLWPDPPLECQAAPQLQLLQARPRHTYLMKKPFSRAWRFKVTPECQFLPAYLEYMRLDEDLALLHRYRAWADYFQIETVLPSLIDFFSDILATSTIPEGAYVVWDHGMSRLTSIR